MATQGLVTVRSDGQVVMKIVAGCDGYHADAFVRRLKKFWPADVESVYALALQCAFGCEEDLVVVTENEIKFEGDDDLHPRYRETFQQPEFNPRCERGTADYTVVIDV